MVKNPSDFVGQHLGHSEKNTKAILESTVGKVLVIDEVSIYVSASALWFLLGVSIGIHAV